MLISYKLHRKALTYGNIALFILADLSVLVQKSCLEEDGSTFLSFRFHLKNVK
jgi:hypothetical protein